MALTIPHDQRYWCQQRYAESVSVAELARIAGLSRHHFTRRFTAAFGEAPSEYLTRVGDVFDLIATPQVSDRLTDAQVCAPIPSHVCGGVTTFTIQPWSRWCGRRTQDARRRTKN